jgi:hypothetical protein
VTDDWLVRVEMPHAVCGFIVSKGGIVLEAAPIMGWAKGMRGRDVALRLRMRGATVTVLPEKGPVSI